MDDETSYSVSRMSCGSWRKVGMLAVLVVLVVLVVSHSWGGKAGARTMGKGSSNGILPSTRHPLSGFVENRRRDGAGPD